MPASELHNGGKFPLVRPPLLEQISTCQSRGSSSREGGGRVLLHLRNLANLELAKRNGALNLMAHSPLQSSRTTKASVACLTYTIYFKL